MEVRVYTERSNARRAARAAGIDPNLVVETEDGFTFAPHENQATASDLDIPAMLRRPEPTAEELAELDQKTKRETEVRIIVMPKANGSKKKKTAPKAAKGQSKNAILLSMLDGKGSSVDDLTKALEWLPHTLRARISRLSKPKSKGGEGLKIERQRVDGVTTYRIAS